MERCDYRINHSRFSVGDKQAVQSRIDRKNDQLESEGPLFWHTNDVVIPD